MNKLALPLFVFCTWILCPQSLDAQTFRGGCVDCSQAVVHPMPAVATPAPVYYYQNSPIVHVPEQIVSHVHPISPCCKTCGQQLCKCELDLNTAQKTNQQQAADLTSSQNLNFKLQGDKDCCENQKKKNFIV